MLGAMVMTLALVGATALVLLLVAGVVVVYHDMWRDWHR